MDLYKLLVRLLAFFPPASVEVYFSLNLPNLKEQNSLNFAFVFDFKLLSLGGTSRAEKAKLLREDMRWAGWTPRTLSCKMLVSLVIPAHD